MVQTTPIYGLQYIGVGEPLRGTRLALENSMKKVEEALSNGGVAATGATDLLTLSGRVSTLETKMTAVEGAGWTTFPLVGAPYMSHFTYTGLSGGGSAAQLQMRLKNGAVQLRGWTQILTSNASGGIWTAGPAHLPAAYRPPNVVTIHVPRNDGTLARLEVSPDGTLRNNSALSSVTGQYLCFDGVGWGLS